MKDIIIRSLSGIVFIGVLIGSILLSPIYLRLCLAIFSMISLYEFSKMTDKNIGVNSRILFVILGISIYFSLSEVISLSVGFRALMLGAPFMILWIKELWSEQNAVKNVAYGTFGLLYCSIPYVMMTWLNDYELYEDTRAYFLLFLFIIVWTNDTFAYLTGRFLGKNKLFERISPKKTWEGTVGGLFFSILAGIIISYYADNNFVFWIISSIIISIFAVLGDLFESMIKRTVGVKDSGNIMPGHGGALDRFDAAIFAAPAFLIWCLIYFS